MHKNYLARIVGGVAVGLAYCAPSWAQERSTDYMFFNRPNGAELVKVDGYESGISPVYVFDCVKGTRTVTFRYYDDPPATDGSDEGIDYESIIPFSVTGLKYGKRCDASCRAVLARMGGDVDRSWKSSGFIYGPISWRAFSRGVESDIKSEPRPPAWHGWTQFAADARRNIARFKSRCGIR